MVIVFGAIVLKEGAFILVPLVWGVFFAFALYPISRWFENKRIPRGMAIILSILLITIFAFSIFYLLLNQMVGLIREIPEIGENLEMKLHRYSDELSLILGKEWLNPNHNQDILAVITPENFQSTLFETGKSLALAGVIPLYSFLFLYYKDFFTEFLFRLSKDNKDELILWVENSGQVIQSYLAGIIRVTGIVAVLCGLFFLAIGVKYFLLFAVFLAIMNLIPYVGVVISSFFVILYVFLTTDSLFYPLVTGFTLWGIQLLENNIITPLVVGSKVKVNALAVILAILLGGWLWGISGMVLFIPLVGVLKITLSRNESLHPFAYLLGDEVPVTELNENFLKILGRKMKKKNPNPHN
ncbi:putative PurR-regulated permease PerM [Algoriphagus boseongensis]|uniref:Putative PurR-regulated permease PerM n=2 Tax=Algoriphagus boseongensis TaxID=1442587 RepID=A0A4R6T5R2_9BACT|nr:putative PurR-regulated permease PerM [Algoriphagus boseongensis]